MANKTENMENNQNNPAEQEEKQCGCACHKSEHSEKSECACHSDGECECKKDISEIEELKAELEKAKAESAKNYDNYLRSVANLDTYRRRVLRDMEEIRKFAIQPFVEELLTSVDNLELAIEHARKNEDFKDMIAGIEMVLGQIKKVFNDFGIEEIRPLGEDFDPNFHECVAHSPSSDYPENKVSSIMRTGYKLNGRLIRPASVVVSSGADKE